MTQDRSIDERISAWLLEDAPSQLPDRVLQATFARTSASRQRRPLPGWWSLPTLTHRWVLVVLALILALAATLLAIGSRLPPPKLPELGRNGLVAVDADWQIHVMNSDGTRRRQISSGPNDFWPIWSPDGSKLVFHRTAQRTGQVAKHELSYWVVTADGSGATNVTNGMSVDILFPWVPSWAPTSDGLVFADGGALASELYVASIDGRSPRRIVDDTLTPSAPTWSPTDRRIAFIGGGPDEDHGVYLVNPDGTGLRLLTAAGPRFNVDTVPLWSPDGTKLLFHAGNPAAEDLWLVNADGSGLQNLTNTPYPIDEAWPTWSPDGKRIAYQRVDHSAHSAAVYVIDADGTNPIRVSADTPLAQPLIWSPDGKHVLTSVCATNTCNEPWDILILDPSGQEKVRRLIGSEPGLGVILSWQRLAP
jgi:TolB protein